MWDAAAPRLLQYLASQDQVGCASVHFVWRFRSLSTCCGQAGGAFQQARWEELVLRLLEKTLAIADDDEWAMELGDEYARQLSTLYASESGADADLKKVALKHVGVVLQKLQHREFIRKKIDAMMAGVYCCVYCSINSLTHTHTNV